MVNSLCVFPSCKSSLIVSHSRDDTVRVIAFPARCINGTPCAFPRVVTISVNIIFNGYKIFQSRNE